MTVLTQALCVREAAVEDLPACVDLLRALQQETHWHQYQGFSLADATAWLITRGCLFVAEEDFQIVGMIGGSLTTHPLFPSVPYVTEEPFYVEQSARNGEAGLLLLRALKQWAIARHAQAVVLGRPSLTGEVFRWHPLGVHHA